jgi:hypothetical protein
MDLAGKFLVVWLSAEAVETFLGTLDPQQEARWPRMGGVGWHARALGTHRGLGHLPDRPAPGIQCFSGLRRGTQSQPPEASAAR